MGSLSSNILGQERASWRHKLKYFLLYAFAYLFLYQYPNLYPRIEPAFLPLLDFEKALPLVPFSFWIYLSDWVLVLSVILVLKNKDEFDAFARTCFIGLIFCGMFFWGYPTTYPRPVYPEDVNAFVKLGMQIVSGADEPTNCFPSMHITMTGMAIWAMRNQGAKKLALYSIWGVAICVSTLTTKQHYLLDLLGGFMVIAVAVMLEAAWRRFKLTGGAVGSYRL